jgi:DNA adenine methylase
MKTPLRYPGGKSRAVKHILPLIPEDCGELCSPFLGGGSIELAVAERGTKVHGYDIFAPLVWFWEALLEDPEKILSYVERYRESVINYTDDERIKNEISKVQGKDNDFRKLMEVMNGTTKGVSKLHFEDIRELVNTRAAKPKSEKLYRAAAQYYIVNRTSFSGATTSGGWSWKASWARLTNSTLKNLKNFKVENFEVRHACFKESIANHPDAFLYLDPPYMLKKEWIPEHTDERTGKIVGGYWMDRDKLYGKDGDLHSSFDHQGLYNILIKRENWILSYNDSPEIRDLYKNYEVIETDWSYGMKNVSTKKMGSSSEILIIG